MKLSEYKGDDALELLADLLEPASEIIGDPDVKEMFQSKEPLLKTVKVILKNHKKAVTEILARLDGQEPEEYEVKVLTLPVKLMELLQDEELLAVFQSQAQNMEQMSSGSATENIAEIETA